MIVGSSSGSEMIISRSCSQCPEESSLRVSRYIFENYPKNNEFSGRE